ncbi:MAG: lasso peptide biosynthesis B2 protein [Pseudomonadota bacterium]
MLTRYVSIRRKLVTWRQFSLLEQGWFLPVWMLLGICRFALLVIPFRLLAPLLGSHQGINIFIPLISDVQRSRAWCIGRTVRVAACYTPWESKCLAQAMTARILLGFYRIPYAFYFGVSKEKESKMQAHAWICAGPVRVTGGTSFGQFTVVGTFVARWLDLAPCKHV